ncbi:cysteine desulfurase family protein [Candidatus Uabimicrobium amorphum]|uniref:cysteine desulfurase n=1 Tax=Uabimicrobium amorphum TaxID=2596890 RepID=A0A5S9ITE8_UABAM|nr:cysteine desulfurase family protein [Candidatus Uabimicrobium amorphum]BBM87769.1 cysteine desulfurase [Candidatus Uabimicrobium amorphum]
MFRKVVQTDCMKRRVVKYYSTTPMSSHMIMRFEKYAKVETFPLLKTYKVNVPHQFLIQGIIDGYQFSVSYKNEHWQKHEEKLDIDLGIEAKENLAEKIYFDYNATTPLDPRVLQKIMPFLQNLYANPHSAHSLGQKVNDELQKARSKVAKIIACSPHELIFTSGGTESINMALLGVVRHEKNSQKRNTIITAATEHSATLKTCAFLQSQGFKIKYLPLENGIVSLSALEEYLDEQTLLVTLMHVNNEVGTIQPVEKIGQIVRNSPALLHIDAVQALGKIPIDVQKIHVDLLSISAHKIYGPKGIGALYVNEQVNISPIIWGGSQEYQLRAGTQNVPGIIGMGEACQIALREMEKNSCHFHTMRQHFLQQLAQKQITFKLNHQLPTSLPTTLNISFPEIDGDTLMMMLDEKGVIVSRGAACNSKSQEPSATLLSLGISQSQARNSLRFSFGKYTTSEEINICINSIAEIKKTLNAKVLS